MEMEVIPENQSGAIGASPLSPAAEKAIVSVDLDMPTKRTELVQKSVDEHNKQVAERRASLADSVPAGFKTRVGLGSIKDFVEKSPGVPLDSAAPEQEATSDLHFGDAINRLMRGMAVARRGWNGVGMFVYHVPANAYPVQTGVAKEYFGENSLVPYNEYLAIKNVNGSVSTWVASINDMMAQDWYVVNVSMLAAFRRNPPVAVMEENQVK